MKSSKNPRQQYGNSERNKSGKRSEKSAKLDRKSSRGMIYENEELRLRTININAEVERGQSDIKRLRRENEHLRREIWTLRDECDRLNKRFKAKLIDYEHGGCNARCSGASSGNRGGSGGCDAANSNSNSDDSDSCDTCRGDDDHCSDDCCADESCHLSAKQKLADDCAASSQLNQQQQQEHIASTSGSNGAGPSLHNAFDHLSIVSEETLSNSELQAPFGECYLGSYAADSQSMAMPSLVGPLTPLTPVELVANQLNDLQAGVPPLSYFENVVQQHLGSNIGCTPETASVAGPGKPTRHTNGWDYNMQSPFARHNSDSNSNSNSNSSYQQTNSSNSACSSAATTSTVIQQPAKFTTFVPATSITPPSAVNTPDIASAVSNPQSQSTYTSSSSSASATTSTTTAPTTIETVAITTMPNKPAAATTSTSTTTAIATATVTALPNSHKHFFSPLKPRLKLNTSLANKNLTMPVAVPAPVAPNAAVAISKSNNPNPSHKERHHQNCDPPDIFVTNALASPYHRQPLPTIKIGSSLVTKPSTSPPPPPIPPPIPQRNSSPQVSPRHHRHHHHYHYHHKSQQQQTQQQQPHHHPHSYHHHHHSHHQEQRRQYHADHRPPNPIIIINSVDEDVGNDNDDDDTDDDDDDDVDMGATTSVSARSTSEPSFTNDTSIGPTSTLHVRTAISTQTAATVLSPTSPQTVVPAERNRSLTNTAVPIYATAQESLKHLISAPALTQPLMATSTATNQRIMTPAPQQTPQPTPQSTPTASPRHCSKESCEAEGKVSMMDMKVQTDSVNLESILHDIENISEDILAIQLEKNKSRENLPTADTNRALQQEDKHKKPYRSEMNLLLTYDGPNATITPTTTATTTVAHQAPPTNGSGSGNAEGYAANRRRTRSLEGDNTDSPSSMPDPMAPFPDNHTYIGFDQLNSAASVATTVPYSMARPPLPPLPPSQLAMTAAGFVSPAKPAVAAKPLPPTPPARVYPPALTIRCAGVARSNSTAAVTSPTPPPTIQSSLEKLPQGSAVHGLSPNKSHLFAAIAHAAAKRAQFRAAPTHITKSLDTGLEDEAPVPQTPQLETTPTTDAARRKARRVSILCDDGTSIATSPDAPATPHKTDAQTMNVNRTSPSAVFMPTNVGSASTSPAHNAVASNPTTGSYTDLTSMVATNPTLRYLKQTSHSTPSSPHSARRRTNSNSMLLPTDAKTPAGNGNHHNGGNGGGPPINQQRKSSQDSTRGHSAELAAAAAIVARSRCSRRHSDGTVVSNIQRISGTSSTGAGAGHHHHHHHGHHGHQHSSSMLSNNPQHHSHHSHQDSAHETATSVSDRNSNSLASSRESSTSFSMRSQRRKISVSSHTGGKIPWCGCWGNGCL